MLDSSIFSQIDKRQLADYRKDVRNNVLQREPFVVHPEKQKIILGSWGKQEKPQLDISTMRKSPLISKIQGGLNFDEIFLNKKTGSKQKAATLTQRKDIEKLLLNPSNIESYFDRSYSSNQNKYRFNTQASAYKESPQRSQQKLERYKSWDNKLDVQLKLQNEAITNKVLREKPGFYIYVNKAKKDLYDQDWLANNSSKHSINDIYPKKQAFTFNDTFNIYPQINQQRNLCSQNSARNAEKYPLTDIVRMTSHFTGLSTQEITAVSKQYISELLNLQQAISRMIKVSNKNY